MDRLQGGRRNGPVSGNSRPTGNCRSSGDFWRQYRFLWGLPTAACSAAGICPLPFHNSYPLGLHCKTGQSATCISLVYPPLLLLIPPLPHRLLHMTLWGFLLFYLRASSPGLCSWNLYTVPRSAQARLSTQDLGGWPLLLIALPILILQGKRLLSVTKELNPNMWSWDMRGKLSHYFVYLFSPNLIFWSAVGQSKPNSWVTCSLRASSWTSLYLPVYHTMHVCVCVCVCVVLET